MSIKEIARWLGYSKQRVYRLITSGKIIGSINQHKSYEIEAKDLEEFLIQCHPPSCQIACLINYED